jgi:superfamily I DNA/RNA helicase
MALLQQIVEELTELSKYAYWKEKKPGDLAESEQNNTEEDFFNIEEVLADIEVVHMKN